MLLGFERVWVGDRKKRILKNAESTRRMGGKGRKGEEWELFTLGGRIGRGRESLERGVHINVCWAGCPGWRT